MEASCLLRTNSGIQLRRDTPGYIEVVGPAGAIQWTD